MFFKNVIFFRNTIDNQNILLNKKNINLDFIKYLFQMVTFVCENCDQTLKKKASGSPFIPMSWLPKTCLH